MFWVPKNCPFRTLERLLWAPRVQSIQSENEKLLVDTLHKLSHAPFYCPYRSLWGRMSIRRTKGTKHKQIDKATLWPEWKWETGLRVRKRAHECKSIRYSIVRHYWPKQKKTIWVQDFCICSSCIYDYNSKVYSRYGKKVFILLFIFHELSIMCNAMHLPN